jgi:glycosyltransferase involved in cell wall biosynthesis
MTKVLFSILITNYNKGKYIKKTIKSCLKQNIKKFEILVYDDCSTDNSLNILRKFKKIKLIKNRKKKFKSGPLNQIDGIIKLFKISKGKIIFLLDGDDEFKSNKLKIISELFKNNIDLNLIQDRAYYKKEEKFLKLKKKQSSIWPSFYPTSCISIRRNYLKKFLIFVNSKKFPNLEIDARLSMFAFLTKNLFFIKNSLTIYHHDDLGIMSKYKKFGINWWKKRNDAFDYFFLLKKKFNQKTKYSIDYYLTKTINFFI